MNKVVLSVVAALAVTAAPAFAADMPVKGKIAAPVAAPSPFDINFGTALTTDYILRGISQSNRKPAIQGYFEPSFKINDMIQLYAGIWGSSLYTGFANAEFDIYGGARFSYGAFGLDVGYVFYDYPGSNTTNIVGNSDLNYGEVYVKPSYKVTDWLTVGGTIYWGDNWGNSGSTAVYYTGNAAVTLPAFLPLGIATSISGEIGRQTFDSTLNALGVLDYTTWNVGIAFNYKAVTLDLRYYDTDLDAAAASFQCISTTGSNLCDERFVATLKFDTTLAALK